jgi:hydroxymethylpyrimidine/phosphomethylpyrimidine kinase
VLDTVMISKSNHALLLPDAVAVVRDELLPLADLLTPNLPEAAALLGVQRREPMKPAWSSKAKRCARSARAPC